MTRRSAARADTNTSARQRARILADLAAAGDNASLDVDGRTLAVTHLSRVYWAAAAFDQPAITKRDYLRYLAEVAPFMCRMFATGR